jgi:uncharacterized protein YggU (UPF0235/DUF167 family)
LRITVKVKPGSRQPGISSAGEVLVVAVRQRAIDGAANAAVVAALAAWFDVAPSRISIEGGASGRLKRIAVEGLNESAYARALQLAQRGRDAGQ